MPATRAERINFIQQSLQARFPTRSALRAEEVADWMAEAWGVAHSVEMCRRRLAAIRAAGSRPVIKRRLHSIVDLAHDLADYLEAPPSTARPPSPSFSPHKGKGKGWRQGINYGAGGKKTIGFATHQGWQLVEAWEDEPTGFDILQGIESAAYRKRILAAKDAAEEFWEEVQSGIIANDRLHALEAVPTGGKPTRGDRSRS